MGRVGKIRQHAVEISVSNYADIMSGSTLPVVERRRKRTRNALHCHSKVCYIVPQKCVTEKFIYSTVHEYLFISCVTETGLKAAKEQHRDYLVATQ